MLIRDTNIKIDRDKCIACGICVERCVMDNLRLSVAPCRQACPLHFNCQGVAKLIAAGKEEQAAAVLDPYLPFIGILERLCHAPCETACARKKVDRPVSIRALQKILSTHSSQEAKRIANDTTAPKRGKKVAIWGSGPAAMMTAWELCRSGHRCVMFHPEKEPGGKLRVLSPIIKATILAGNEPSPFVVCRFIRAARRCNI